MIADYLEALSAALSFDRSLARSVAREVEDHLRAAAAADPSGDGIAAEERAIARFGDPRAIAAQFAGVSLAKSTKKLGAVLVLVVAGIFVAMKGRIAWYAVAGDGVSDQLRAVSEIVGPIDHFSFWASVMIAIGGFAYATACRAPAVVHDEYCRRLRRFFAICLAATTPLAVSVISDGVLTAIRLMETASWGGALIPLGSMAVEIACIGALAFYIRAEMQRTAVVAAAVSNS